MIRHLSANYSHSNHNFAILNLPQGYSQEPYIGAVRILQNLLQRGKPTMASSFLQQALGLNRPLHCSPDFLRPYPLIDQQIPQWERLIRGNERDNHIPAKRFLEELLPKHLPKMAFICPLILPEAPIETITQTSNTEFGRQQVDFFLPQANLVIEIDGKQHLQQQEQDQERDAFLQKHGIEVVRIQVSDLEAENAAFMAGIEHIQQWIRKISAAQKEAQQQDPTLITLTDYWETYQQLTPTPFHQATAIIRFQLLLLCLLENGQLSLSDTEWHIGLYSHDVRGIWMPAFEDLMIWLEHLLQLQNIPFRRPILKLHTVADPACQVRINFSLLKRYTDEHEREPETIFVRTGYLDHYCQYSQGDGMSLNAMQVRDHDFFEISSQQPIEYPDLNLSGGEDHPHVKAMNFLLYELFMQAHKPEEKQPRFREGQLEIIANVLTMRHTIGLLPTGSGKSLCYHLACLLQPAASFVVSPIKSLMYDQVDELRRFFISRVAYLSSDLSEAEKAHIQGAYGSGKLLWVLVAPERFQNAHFRDYLRGLRHQYHIAYAVIDEVHCLSEWGHDFRLSYLNLAQAVRNCCGPGVRFLGLTATASLSVLKDIQVALGVSKGDVRTPTEYGRKELQFHVLDDGANKPQALLGLLRRLKREQGAFHPNGDQTRCGVIFTSAVNGTQGCFRLSEDLTTQLNMPVGYYSGSAPKQVSGTPEAYEQYKKDVQDRFKQNDLSLLVATKAFGMGINKGNIHYTFHYGIPPSMESLYQEAGRAGRDKQRFRDTPAHCYVLLGKSQTDSYEALFSADTSLENLKKLQVSGDMGTHFFMMQQSLSTYADTIGMMERLAQEYAHKGQNVLLRGSDLGAEKFKVEGAIYRLSQLGVVLDWRIENFIGGGSFRVDFGSLEPDSMQQHLLAYIGKYDQTFSIDDLQRDEYKHYQSGMRRYPLEAQSLAHYAFILLQWSYENFVYGRRQSLKNVYENCLAASEGKISAQAFKQRLENYFQFNDTTTLLVHLADHPMEYAAAMKLFFVEEMQGTGARRTTIQRPIERPELNRLRDQLGRFLESQNNNPSLNIASGLTRLLLDQFDDPDGRDRLDSALRDLLRKGQEPEKLLWELLRIRQLMSQEQQWALGKLLCQHFRDEEQLLKIGDQLKCPIAHRITIEQYAERLKNITKDIKQTIHERTVSA